MSNFKVGDKVVCVNPTDKLVKGEIYTINQIVYSYSALVLAEIPIDLDGFRVGYYAWRFRKIDYQFGHDICAELSRQYNEEFIEL